MADAWRDIEPDPVVFAHPKPQDRDGDKVAEAVAAERERIARLIESHAPHEGVRAQRVIRMLAYAVRNDPPA